MFKTIAFVGALALTGLATQASAFQLPSQTVSTAGVDFHNQASVKALYARLYRAADTVCHLAQSDRACIRETMAAAVSHADHPALTAMYQSQYGGVAKYARYASLESNEKPTVVIQ